MDGDLEFKNILFEKEENLAVVTINRPKALNAINSEVLKELDEVIDNIRKDDDIYCVVLMGSGGKAFVAGADLMEMKDLSLENVEKFAVFGNSVFRKIETLNKPVIAAINGLALGGGCELAMTCDIRVASEKASFAFPEVGLGITPGFGGTQRLPRIVGVAKAKELIYSCARIKADEALRIGLVNKVVPIERLVDEVKELAKTIMNNAPIAVRLCKDAIDRGIETDIDEGIKIEINNMISGFDTEDKVEGISAFLEKRDRKFNNK